MKNVVISVLGTIKDASRNPGPERWNAWRPTVSLVRHADLPVDELHLIYDPTQFQDLADFVANDIEHVSPSTKVVLEKIALKDPWDFEEVYVKFYDLFKRPCFHEKDVQYLVHLSTGTHVEQICLFLLTESRHIPGHVVQTSAKEGHGKGRESTDSIGRYHIIDLDLSKYSRIVRRHEAERKADLSFFKEGAPKSLNKDFNDLIARIERVASRSPDPILLTGPTGAGKSVLAKRIYDLKKKKKDGGITEKFIAVNCATLGGNLAQGLLFGYKKGAFTGATSDHDGYLLEANKGLLFLDEIGELPMESQTMLLKAIEEKKFRPLGGTTDATSDFQLVCGTNKDLDLAVENGTFREDLLARIDLWRFRLPGISERREDIEPTLDEQLARVSRTLNREVGITPDARARFLKYALDPDTTWAGNFRDLNGMITRLATLADGDIGVQNVEEEIARTQQLARRRVQSSPSISAAAPSSNLADYLGEDGVAGLDLIERAQLEKVISVCRESESAADAGKKLYAVSRMSKKTANDSDRLSKYLLKYGLTFKQIQQMRT